jgi:hypothetical protein
LRRFPRSGVGLADVLTPAALAVCVWVVVASERVATGTLPAAVAAAFIAADYRVWRNRGTPWHDPLVLVLLVPALAAALWIGVGGIALGVERGAAGRLLVEVGPGLALTGLVTTLMSYHGRHRP